MRHATQKAVIVILFTCYALFGILLEYYIHREIYPVFSWSLFSIMPNPKKEPTIYVHEMRGVTYDPPLSFTDMKFIFDEIGQSPTQYTAFIRTLGAALKNDNIAEIAKERRKIEALFGDEPYRYDVVLSTYDPVHFYKTHTAIEEHLMATFTNTQ